MKGPSETGIRPPSIAGAKAPRSMRGRLEMGGTGEYLRELAAVHEGIRATTVNVSAHVVTRTDKALNHASPPHAISGRQLPAHLNEHVQHGSTGDHREALIAASIAARTRGQLDK